MLEKMAEFFDSRIEEYEEHQMNAIRSASEFYPFTASLLPKGDQVSILDLGCGTGLELDFYYRQNPNAAVTGIDLAPGMLSALKAKFPGKNLTLIQGSYFEIPLGHEIYDAVVSVESLHHFTKERKLSLYRKVCQALKRDGFFILTDYFAASQEDEFFFFQELKRLKSEQGISDQEFYHYDTPLTVEHEMQVLKCAGFCDVKILGRWGDTCCLKALKPNSPL